MDSTMKRPVEYIVIWTENRPIKLANLVQCFVARTQPHDFSLREKRGKAAPISFGHYAFGCAWNLSPRLVLNLLRFLWTLFNLNDYSYAVIPLPGKIKSTLKRWKAIQSQHKLLQPNDYNDSDYICTQIDGRLFRPAYVTQHFKRLLRNNNLPEIRFHDLRHSAAGYLKYLGFDLKDIQTWLRHKDIQTTMNIYVNLDMEAKRNIADKLNDKFVDLMVDKMVDMNWFYEKKTPNTLGSLDFTDESFGTRTRDNWIKSPVLYQLS